MKNITNKVFDDAFLLIFQQYFGFFNLFQVWKCYEQPLARARPRMYVRRAFANSRYLKFRSGDQNLMKKHRIYYKYMDTAIINPHD